LEKLRHNIIKIYGSRGEDWLVRLPQIVASLKKDWDLSDLKALSPLSYSYVLEGMRGQVPM